MTFPMNNIDDDNLQFSEEFLLRGNYNNLHKDLAKEIKQSSSNKNRLLIRLLGEPDIPTTSTAVAYPFPLYTLRFDMVEEILKAPRPFSDFIDIPKNICKDTDDRKPFHSDILIDDLVLDEEDSKLFLEEIDNLNYSPEVIKFYKKSKETYKKIKNGEFLIDL